MDSEEGRADPLILQRRAEIKDVYTRLLVEHPALPPEIRVFQVQLETCSLPFRCIHHRLIVAVDTGQQEALVLKKNGWCWHLGG